VVACSGASEFVGLFRAYLAERRQFILDLRPPRAAVEAADRMAAQAVAFAVDRDMENAVNALRMALSILRRNRESMLSEAEVV